ncbi:hypothetical protein ACFSYC_08850 [Mucilaginibacter antarcticus]|uniref:Uncharacterized protein n=1 Tax=Mucilaginibacter antarcticus TaxID=1855725 RepID=A0ABW5XS58_9SPHI
MRKNVTKPTNVDSAISQMNALESEHPDIDVSGRCIYTYMKVYPGLRIAESCRKIIVQVNCHFCSNTGSNHLRNR